MLALNNGSFRFLISTAYTCLLHHDPTCSVDSLFGKFGLVLIFDADVLESVELFGLNALDLKSFIFETLTHFASFFEVVETSLLARFSVVADLTADGVRVVPQMHLLLLVNETLLLLSALMLFDDLEERVAFEFGLLAEHLLALHELHLARNVESLSLLASLLSFSDLLGTFIALVLLERTLLAESINLSLTVCGTLLKVTEPFYFHLLFILEFLLLGDLSLNHSALLGLVDNNLHVFILLLDHFLRLLIKGNIIGLFNFCDHVFVALFLLLGLDGVRDFHLLDVLKHLGLLLFEELTLLNTFLLSLSDLVNDNHGTGLPGTCSAGVALLLLLERLQAFDLHHEVEFFLLGKPFLFESFGLNKLFVADGYNF
jgi:hypothetical protein